MKRIRATLGVWPLAVVGLMAAIIACSQETFAPLPAPPRPTAPVPPPPQITPPPPTAPAVDTRPVAPPAGTLTVALQSIGDENLDPSMSSRSDLLSSGHMYDFLLGAKPDGKLSASMGALDSFEISPDAKTYTLWLRKGMRWHDGVEVTSADIEFSIAHYARTESNCEGCVRSMKWDVEQVKVVDRYTARIHLNAADVFFLRNFGPVDGDMPLLPKHHWEKAGDKGLAENPLGSGPWKFVRISPGQSIEYEANLDYWDKERVPGFSRLRLIEVPDAEERVTMLKAGEVDMAVLRPAGSAFSPELVQADVSTLKEDGFSIQGPKYVTNAVLRFFMSYDPAYLTSKLEFRKALILGLDLKSLVEETYPPEVATRRAGAPMTTPSTIGYDAALPPYPYDPDLAKEWLRESGYDGEIVRLFSIATFGLPEMHDLNEMMAEQWRRIGVNVELIKTDYAEIEERMYPRPQQFQDVGPAPLFHGADYRPQPGFGTLIKRYMSSDKSSMMAYPDPEKGDRILAELAALGDPEQRDKKVRELGREWYEEYWAAPVLWRHEVYGLSPRLEGWQPTNGTSLDLHLETVRPIP